MDRKEYIKSVLGDGNPNWKGGRRKKKCGKHYYWFCKANNHPKVKHLPISKRELSEHRLLMEKYLGRYLKSYEHIHHLNGDTLDNRIENLKLITKGEHNKIHKRVTDYIKNGGDRSVFSPKKYAK